MTAIEFHVNVPDKLHYSYRLLRKAYRSGANAVVTATPELLLQLDKVLWSYSSTEFLPHCRSDSAAATTAATPILLAEQLDVYPPGSVLINLGLQVPGGFERFERFIEVASISQDDRLAARERWKHYRDRGYALKRHELPSTQEDQ